MNWGYIFTPDLVALAGVMFGLFVVPMLLARFHNVR